MFLNLKFFKCWPRLGISPDLSQKTDYNNELQNCIDTIVMPDFLRGLLGIGTMFLKSACDEYGFNVGPFSKCMEKVGFL